MNSGDLEGKLDFRDVALAIGIAPGFSTADMEQRMASIGGCFLRERRQSGGAERQFVQPLTAAPAERQFVESQSLTAGGAQAPLSTAERQLEALASGAAGGGGGEGET